VSQASAATSAVIAIDIGGTSMKGALVGPDGAVLRASEAATPVLGSVDNTVLASILAYAGELAEEAVAVTGRGPVAAGFGVPGVLDEARGVARYAANLGWRDVPLRAEASRALGVPAVIGHDVRTAALAEARFGAARGQGDFLYLAIGTGIAGALFVGGRAYAGVSARGGELGHAPVGAAVAGSPEACRCGQDGCLEAYASAAAIQRRYAARGGDPTVATPEIVERASTGAEALARTVWTEAVDALATALAWYTLVLDPALVVIGGGLAAAGEALFAPVRACLADRLAFREPPPVRPGELGQHAGRLGAAVLAWRTVGRDLITLA
jgi:glucokinase